MARITQLLSKRGQTTCAGKSLTEVLNPLFYRHADLTDLDVRKLDIIRESVAEYRKESTIGQEITSTPQATRICQDLIGDEEREVLLALFLNTKGKIIGVEKIFKGTIDRSVAHPREVFRSALQYPTHSILIAHNHPSGDPRPSNADLRFTEKIIQSGNIIGIPVIDHIIVAQNDAVSLHETTNTFDRY